MKNRQIAIWGLVSAIIFIIAVVVQAEQTYTDGFTQIAYYVSCIGIYVFGIWGWIRLIRSDK